MGIGLFELGLDRLVDLKMKERFIGKDALIDIKNKGIKKIFCGFEIGGPPLKDPSDEHIDILNGTNIIGKITSSVYSPRLKKNIGMGYLPIKNSSIGFQANTNLENIYRSLVVIEKPFYDPKKNIAKGS